MRQPGEVIADCPSCGEKGGVQFREYNDGVPEAACVNCGEIFRIEDDPPPESAPAPAPSPTPAPAPTPEPAPAPAPPPATPPPAAAETNPELNQAFAAIGELTPVQDTGDPKSRLHLDGSSVSDFVDSGVDLPAHIRNSRAWRWAQRMGNTGNPYRENSRNHEIFDLYARADLGLTIEECVTKCAEKGYNEKLSYLLTVYEVTAHCLSSGLLVMHPESRIISVCQGKPMPVKVT